nr:MAG TPA: DNA cytosine methyltransferase [Bacteriophage sp.]
MIKGELIVDNFAGGGGASTGIEMATGYSVDIAINHDPEAIRMHKANHPNTKHYCEDVWQVDPVEACNGHPVGLAWFSPDCKHFSKAKGGKPKDKFIRGLAWVACRWAGLVRPRVIMLENVEEFKTWGPLNRRHHPIKAKQGKTFEKFVQQLTDLGYEVQFKELVAADYGAPTMRKRFFMIARCDGKSIIWPEPTHGPADSEAVKAGLLKPYVGAYTQLDFSLPCPSIFDTSEEIKEKYGIRAVRPLAPKTMERIARGIKKFVVDNADPFLIEIGYGESKGQKNPRAYSIEKPLHTIVAKDKNFLVAPILTQYHSYEKDGLRGQGIENPIMTVDGSNRYGLVTSFLSKFYKNGIGQDIREPLGTVTANAGGGHFGEVRAFLERYDVCESNRCNKRTDRLRDNSSKERREILEDIEQAVQRNGYSSGRSKENGSKFEVGVSGSSCLEGRETVSDACAQSSVGNICRDNPRRNGYQPQEWEQTGQQVGKSGSSNTESEPYPCDKNRSENLQQLSREIFGECKKVEGQRNVVFEDRERTRNISNSGVSSGEFQAHTLIKYYGQGVGQDVKEPLDTVTSRDRFGLVTIEGVDYQIVDIGLRMLEPRELYGCQGFPDDYIIDHDYTGKTYPRSEQVRRCGNAVCPPIPAALVRANLPELCVAERTPNMRIEAEQTGQLRFA